MVRTGITDEGLRCLAASRSLQGLYLDDNHLITATGVEYLASGGSQLSIISLGGCALDNAVAEPLLRIKSVRYLNLARNSNVSDRTLEILRGTGSKIVSLFLAFDPITDAGVHSLTYYRDLVSLDLSGIKLSQRSIKYLASMKQLKYLYLDECALNPDQVNGLTKALPKTKIQFDRPASFKLAFNSKGEQ